MQRRPLAVNHDQPKPLVQSVLGEPLTGSAIKDVAEGRPRLSIVRIQLDNPFKMGQCESSLIPRITFSRDLAIALRGIGTGRHGLNVGGLPFGSFDLSAYLCLG